MRAEPASAAAESATSDDAMAAAVSEINEVLAAEVPAHISASDRRVVRQDLAFQLARLQQRQGHSREAVAAADLGLAEGSASDLFVANLYIVRAEAEESLGDAHAAAEDYYRALRINESLMHQLLGDHP